MNLPKNQGISPLATSLDEAIEVGSLREAQAILDLCPTQAERARKMADCLEAVQEWRLPVPQFAKLNPFRLAGFNT